MTGHLEGKVALVTGGSSGIGRACAIAFARVGARVVIADLAVEGGEETLDLIRQAGGEGLLVRTDVSKAVEVEALVAKTVETYGRLDCAHNNAGIAGALAPLAQCTEENCDNILTTNLKSVWLCMKYEIPQMLKQGGGSIVNTSSTAGLSGSRYASAYAASSHGVIGLTKSAALEYAEAGLRINAVCPGIISTPMIERHTGGDPEVEARLTAPLPLKRLGSPEEVAEAVVWLCSDAASYVTGHALVVDGGRMAQ